MNDAAVIKATYSEYRMVKSRKVLQLIFEVPLEHQKAVADALGYPMPDAENWVAIAALRKHAADEPEPDEVEVRQLKPLSQVAAYLGTIVAFRQFLMEKAGHSISGPDEAANVLREICGVKSRKELDADIAAARRFRDLKADYDNWLRDAA